MDSINNQQPENNHKDLSRQEAIEKIKELVRSAETCFFCTQNGTGESMGTRPMSVQDTGDNGILWFLCANDSHTVKEINMNSEVRLYFKGSAHSDFLFLKGKATASQDKAKIKALWKPVLKTWFTEGEHDPRITVLKVTAEEGYYWDNKHGNAVAGIKMLIGAAIGKTLDDSIEGKITT